MWVARGFLHPSPNPTEKGVVETHSRKFVSHECFCTRAKHPINYCLVSVGVELLGVGSGSRGAGGGVVSIVQPIQPAITKTSTTNNRTGSPMAHSLQTAGSPRSGAKNAIAYTMSTMIESKNIAKP
jgi:hypothetical protein